MSLRRFLCACCCFNSDASVSPSSILLPYCTSSSFILSRRQGWNTRQSIIILSMIWVMFALSTAHWIADLTLLLRRIDSSPLIVDSSFDTIFSAFAKINVSKLENNRVTLHINGAISSTVLPMLFSFGEPGYSANMNTQRRFSSPLS